jgi:hypothetical protein
MIKILGAQQEGSKVYPYQTISDQNQRYNSISKKYHSKTFSITENKISNHSLFNTNTHQSITHAVCSIGSKSLYSAKNSVAVYTNSAVQKERIGCTMERGVTSLSSSPSIKAQIESNISVDEENPHTTPFSYSTPIDLTDMSPTQSIDDGAKMKKQRVIEDDDIRSTKYPEVISYLTPPAVGTVTTSNSFISPTFKQVTVNEYVENNAKEFGLVTGSIQTAHQEERSLSTDASADNSFSENSQQLCDRLEYANSKSNYFHSKEDINFNNTASMKVGLVGNGVLFKNGELVQSNGSVKSTGTLLSKQPILMNLNNGGGIKKRLVTTKKAQKVSSSVGNNSIRSYFCVSSSK